jgi:hypothetical protein
MNHRVSYQYRHIRHPSDGLYIALKNTTGLGYGADFVFKYHPGGEVFHKDDYGYGNWEARKNRVTFAFDRSEVLNYDQISLEDIEFYINCRTERHNYLSSMPLLFQLKKMRLEELEREKCFVQLVANRNKVLEQDVWKLVDWWKFKNKWKRPIDQDDAKALRMIERKLKQN